MAYSSVFIVQPNDRTRYGGPRRSLDRLLNGIKEMTAQRRVTDSDTLPLPQRPRIWSKAVDDLYPNDHRSGYAELRSLVRTLERSDRGYQAMLPYHARLPNEQLLMRYAQLRRLGASPRPDLLDTRMSDLETHRMLGTEPSSNEDLDRMRQLTYVAEHPHRVPEERLVGILEIGMRNGIEAHGNLDRSASATARQLALDQYLSLANSWFGVLEPLAFKNACREGLRSGGHLVGRAKLASVRSVGPIGSFLSENRARYMFV